MNVFINCRISISKTYYQLKFIQSKPFRKKIICFIMQSQIFQNKCVFREVVVRRCSVEKIFLKISQNSKENTCARISRPQACNFIKKETLAQVLSFEFCKISQNTFFYRTSLVATSDFPVFHMLCQTNLVFQTIFSETPQ